MKKITEISEIRYRTVREKDALGNRIAKKVPYTAFRPVRVVSGGKRFAHFFVDWLIFECAYTMFSSIIALLPLPDQSFSFQLVIGIFTISIFLTFMYPIYYLLFEYFLQKTPGKFLTRCRVIDIYGNKPPIGTIILRSIIRLVPFEPFSCLFGERGWHDRWSDTFVVPDDEYEAIQKLLAENP